MLHIYIKRNYKLYIYKRQNPKWQCIQTNRNVYKNLKYLSFNNDSTK